MLRRLQGRQPNSEGRVGKGSLRNEESRFPFRLFGSEQDSSKPGLRTMTNGVRRPTQATAPTLAPASFLFSLSLPLILPSLLPSSA
eukprot:76087-Rhodomonas_salina.8